MSTFPAIMKYDMGEFKVIHWDYNRMFPKNIVMAETEHVPRFELFPDPNDKSLWSLLIRWTFRILEGKENLLSYITEQEFIVKFEKQPDNLERIKNLFGTSLLQNSIEFDKLKATTILEVVSIPYYEIPEQELRGLLDSFESATL